MEKIKLYHYSDKDFTGRINIKFFNDNSYTFNDYKSCKIKRAFYYTDNSIIEYNLQGAKFLYIIEVNKNKIYDLQIDKKQIKNRFNTIPELLTYLKNNFSGAYYQIGGLKIVILFENIEFKSKIKRGF